MSEPALRYDFFEESGDAGAPLADTDNVIRIYFGGPKDPNREIEPYPVDHLISGLVSVEFIEDARQSFLDGSNPLTAQEQQLLAAHDDVAWWPSDDDY